MPVFLVQKFNFDVLYFYSVCGGRAEAHAEQHPLHESEKTQSSCSHTVEERPGPDSRGKPENVLLTPNCESGLESSSLWDQDHSRKSTLIINYTTCGPN